MGRLKSTVLVVLATVFGLTALFTPQKAQAADSAALSITPKKNYTIQPGKSVNDTLTIRNLDRKEPLKVSLRVVDFTFNDDGGAPKLMTAEDAPQTTWSLKPFIELPKQVTIEPQSTKTIDMKVAIPAGHGAGSYYSAIMYSSGGSDGGNVGLSATGVTLAFVTVPGKVKEDLQLKGLGVYDREKVKAVRTDKADQVEEVKYPYFVVDMPENIGYTLKNDGNVTESPVGSIKLKHLFGKEYDIDNINPNGSLALIGQTRTFTPCIKLKKEDVNFNGTRSEATTCTDPGLWPGYYTVELSAFYGQNGNRTQDLVGKASFWYLPWWFILVSMVVIAYVSFQVWKLVRFIKKRQGKSAARSSTKRRK